MITAISGARPPAIHHEHSPWPQRYATLIGVVGLHVAAGMALLAMHLNAPSTLEPPVLTVRWVPVEKPLPSQPRPVQKPKEPPPKKTIPEPAQKPVPVPQVKQVEAPLIQAPAAAVETPRAPPAPPQAPAPAAPAQVVQAAPAPQAEPVLRADIDCTQAAPPRYPNRDQLAGNAGRVMLHVQTDERGRMLQVVVEKSSGFSTLDHAAQEAVRQWICPVHSGKNIVGGWARIPIDFVPPSL